MYRYTGTFLFIFFLFIFSTCDVCSLSGFCNLLAKVRPIIGIGRVIARIHNMQVFNSFKAFVTRTFLSSVFEAICRSYERLVLCVQLVARATNHFVISFLTFRATRGESLCRLFCSRPTAAPTSDLPSRPLPVYFALRAASSFSLPLAPISHINDSVYSRQPILVPPPYMRSNPMCPSNYWPPDR